MNNLRLAVEGASKEDLSWLPADNVRQLHGAVKQLGHDRALWYGSWGQAAGVASYRQLPTSLPPVTPQNDFGEVKANNPSVTLTRKTTGKHTFSMILNYILIF